MIKRDSIEWQILLRKLEKSKLKSSRDSLCLKCWCVFGYEQKLIHSSEYPLHHLSIVTSKMFAGEQKFIGLAKLVGKFKKDEEGEYFHNPYLNKRKRN